MKVRIKVTIGELVLTNSELESLRIVQELGEHTRCRAEFTRDRSQEIRLDDLLKQPVTVTVQEDDADPSEIFQGSIADGSQAHLLHYGSRFVIEAISPSVRHEFRDTVYFAESTLKKIAGDVGAQTVRVPSRPACDYVQWGETELEFLRRVADEHGCHLVTTGPSVEIRRGFEGTPTRLVWGETLLEMKTQVRNVNNGITGANYDPQTKAAHRHEAVRKDATGTGGASKLVRAAADVARGYGGGGDPLLGLDNDRSTSAGDFKTLLQGESERIIGSAVTVECVSGKPGLMVGELVDLVEGQDFQLPTSGVLGLAKVVHEFDDQHYRNRFVATPWKHYSNAGPPRRQRVDGPVTAEVVEVGTDPDGLHRVRVHYSWQEASDPSDWARLVVPHAGNDRGTMFYPEVGDEVLVVFEQGDAERPLVVGALWNGKDTPPHRGDDPRDNHVKCIRTRSGNTIRFNDESGKEHIEIATPLGECLIRLDLDGQDPQITVRSAGDLNLEADGEIRLKSKTFVQEVKGESKRKIGADESVDVKQKFSLKAGMDLGLAAGVGAVLKGTTVETVAAAVNNVVGGMVQIQPPGFMGKQVQAKPVTIEECEVGKRDRPETVEFARTADSATPRTA